MDNDTVQAMWHDSNINMWSARILLHYLKATFRKYMIILQSKGNGGDFKNIGNYIPVRPDSNFCEIGKESVFFYQKYMLIFRYLFVCLMNKNII